MVLWGHPHVYPVDTDIGHVVDFFLMGMPEGMILVTVTVKHQGEAITQHYTAKRMISSADIGRAFDGDGPPILQWKEGESLIFQEVALV